MAALLIDSPSNNKTSFQIAVRAVELLLISAGLVSTFLMFKGAVSPYSYDLMLSNMMKPLSYFRTWLSSTFYICIVMNFIVILIAVSSLFHHPKMDNNGDIEDCGDGEGYDLHSDLSSSLSPPSAPPPMQNNHQKHLQDTEPKEIFAVAAAAAAAVTATKEDGGKIKTTKASLKNQQDPQHRINGVEKVDESFQEVFSGFSRLAEAKEIKKAPTTKGGGKMNNAMASLKNQQDSNRDTNIGVDDQVDKSFEAVFSDFYKLKEAKEIKKSHSLESSSQVITNQKSKKTSTTKNGQQKQLEQTNKLLKSEEGEEEDDDTMEATWRAINGGGAKPQEKDLKKSETWPQPQTVVAAAQDNNINDLDEDMPSSAAAWKELRKSMTFNDTVSIWYRGGLRRDPSTNLEELNQRFEAAIKKFNNELRLQRQESEQRNLDMIIDQSRTLNFRCSKPSKRSCRFHH